MRTARTNPRRLPDDDVSGALDASHLFTRYQPIVAFADRTLFALEVLARLDHPTVGRVFPSQFVPQLEDAGLARQLTELVIHAALADVAAHLTALPVDLSLNLPLDVLMAPDCCETLGQLCAGAGVPAGALILELTESQPIANLNCRQRGALEDAMRRLHQAGFRLAIDDYGPAMTDRREVFELPIDLLKLDRAVTQDAAWTGIIVEAVAWARERGIKVVVEGIETEEMWSRMQALGIDYAQGFLISRPLPACDVAGWRASWSAPG